MTNAADKAWMKEVLSDFLLDFLGETGAMGYFPDMSEEEWLESIPDECVERLMENFVVVEDEEGEQCDMEMPHITNNGNADLFDLARIFDNGSATVSLSEAADRICQGERLDVCIKEDGWKVLVLGGEEIGKLRKID